MLQLGLYRFVYARRKGIKDLIDKLCDEEETMSGLCYLGHKLNVSGGCKAAVTARARIAWARFRKGGELK